MGIEHEFLNLMKKITGVPDMRMEDKMGKNREQLENNCRKIQREASGELTVDIEKGNEPCPFCHSRRDAKAKMVWVGINPGAPVDNFKQFYWEKTTWQEIIDYCVPKDIRTDDDCLYARLVDKNGNVNGYFKLIMRMFMQLDNEWPNNVGSCWGDYRKHYKIKEKVPTRTMFLDYFYNKPVLSADLIPYKSQSISMKVDGLLGDAYYKDYFQHLMKIILEYSEDDAWVIFFKQPDEVKKLMDKFTPSWSPSKDNEKEYDENDKKKKMYVYKFMGRRIVIMPFKRNYDSKTANLVKAIKDKLSEYSEKDGE